MNEQARPGGYTRKTPGGDSDSTEAATEVRALAGVHVERPNYNIGRSILCSPKRSPIFCNSPRNESSDSSATAGAFSNYNFKILAVYTNTEKWRHSHFRKGEKC